MTHLIMASFSSSEVTHSVDQQLEEDSTTHSQVDLVDSTDQVDSALTHLVVRHSDQKDQVDLTNLVDSVDQVIWVWVCLKVECLVE